MVCAACTVQTSPEGLRAPADKTPRPASVSPSATRQCDQDQIQGAIRDFIDSWNDHDRAGLRGLFAEGAELEMSTKNQRARSPATHGGFASVSGWNGIEAFVDVQWRLGETLDYESLQPFNGGAYARNMTAMFSDGSTQPFSEAKFAFDCVAGAFDHIEIVSAAEAS